MRAGVIVGKKPFQCRIFLFQSDHSIINVVANLRLRCFGLNCFPASFFRPPEDIGGGVFIAVFRVSVLSICPSSRIVILSLKSIGNVLKKDQAEYDMLEFRRSHMPAHLISHFLNIILETEVAPPLPFFAVIKIIHCFCFTETARLIESVNIVNLLKSNYMSTVIIGSSQKTISPSRCSAFPDTLSS